MRAQCANVRSFGGHWDSQIHVALCDVLLRHGSDVPHRVVNTHTALAIGNGCGFEEGVYFLHVVNEVVLARKRHRDTKRGRRASIHSARCQYKPRSGWRCSVDAQERGDCVSGIANHVDTPGDDGVLAITQWPHTKAPCRPGNLGLGIAPTRTCVTTTAASTACGGSSIPDSIDTPLDT